jgi:hypothetical protein
MLDDLGHSIYARGFSNFLHGGSVPFMDRDDQENMLVLAVGFSELLGRIY